ncbi:hypothetical protein [Planktothrix prolifica]|uniref:Uncharacterized protein n=2 Tax=Microcoleaceae TaxID=1892252 RepID=A0A6J7ZHR2_PLARU|nr:hypothetical protein [Planktothrix prolifica]CAC5343444.1 hypothetical protein PLAN_30632 [Planktothrix rubescens NIVA-CYA 18]CAD5979371.1 hypothetical protein PCC7821_04465 [Planktothrix rubescens NIVA-CYA 18]CAH2575009.1 hypothetical protein PRNO82_04372 [Planktothrix rubescens]
MTEIRINSAMDEEKKKRLEAKGWKVGTVAEFLELTPEEAMLVEIKLALSRNNQEILVEIREVNDFWSALQDFRQKVDLESIDDNTFENLRDKLPGREVDL